MERNIKAPLYVKINEYKEILDIIDVMKQKVSETKDNIKKLKEIKAEEDKQIADWEKNLDEINKRISFVDSAFFENE